MFCGWIPFPRYRSPGMTKKEGYRSPGMTRKNINELSNIYRNDNNGKQKIS